jgi:hypothetical protein
MNTSLGAISEMLYCNRGGSRGGFPEFPVKARANMKWFRSNIRLGSRLALLGLAIQFLLSFGHFHGASASADRKRPGVHDTIAFVATQPDALDQASPANVVGPVRSKTSSGQQPSGHPGDDCAICDVMALASTMLDAAPPLLLSPHATAFFYGAVAAPFAEPDSVRLAFQPRAPPIA